MAETKKKSVFDILNSIDISEYIALQIEPATFLSSPFMLIKNNIFSPPNPVYIEHVLSPSHTYCDKSIIIFINVGIKKTITPINNCLKNFF